MHIGFIFALFILLVFISVILYDSSPILSRIFILSIVLVAIWASTAASLEKKKEIFLKKVPVSFQDKIAFSTYNSNLINCSKKFKVQFKPGDTIYVYEQQDSKKLGIIFSGGEFLFKLNNDSNLVCSSLE
jgi:glucan phosphoethanolaminetransferase (alkaline phosphatase superfamily)